MISDSEWDPFLDKFFPHRVDLYLKHLEGYNVVSAIFEAHEAFGPARFRTRFLTTLHVYVLDTLEEKSYYSRTGTWFMVHNEFYFANHNDAVLFKLRHG